MSELRLLTGKARYEAFLSAESDARRTLSRLDAARDAVDGTDELAEQLGGFFSFPQAKQSFFTTPAYLQLGDAAGAEREASLAIELYSTGPAELRAFACEATSQIDLASSRLMRNELEGAQQALSQVLVLPPDKRVDWLVGRLNDFRLELTARPFAENSLALSLGAEIEAFGNDSVALQLPGKTGI